MNMLWMMQQVHQLPEQIGCGWKNVMSEVKVMVG